MFKIFYSWQSDLPSSKTRSFIKSCINEAIDLAKDTEAIEAERDEATLRTTGSPDIVQTLFSKIDECDYFIADVSLCFTEDTKGQKKAPNPNVMLELGYAVKTLSWNRVLCVCNTDFGDDFPFDFDHNRRTVFSFERKDKGTEKYRVTKRIFEDIRDLRNAPPRAKVGMATHILGSYDLEQKKVTSVLVPLKIEQQESYILHNRELIEDSKKLVEEIRKIEIKASTEVVSKTQEPNLRKTRSGIYALESLLQPELPVRIDIEDERGNIKKWLEIDVDDEFFNCGNLKRKNQLLGGSEEYVGSNEEKEKYDKLSVLSYYLTQLEMRSLYLKTFDGMLFIPLAIQNISEVEDHNIRTVVHVVNGEIVNPTEEFICKELEGAQGIICRDDDENSGVGIIDELFILPDDGYIHTEEMRFDPSDFHMKTPMLIDGRLQYPGKDEKDYLNELEDYIANSNGTDYYEFEVESLRPGECRWVSQGMLIRPDGEDIKIHYQIYSSHSSGELSGDIVYKQT